MGFYHKASRGRKALFFRGSTRRLTIEMMRSAPKVLIFVSFFFVEFESFGHVTTRRYFDPRCADNMHTLLQVSADKKLKKAALDNALTALADPTKVAKVDPVSQAFAQYWKQKAADMEKNKDKVRFVCVAVFALDLVLVLSSGGGGGGDRPLC